MPTELKRLLDPKESAETLNVSPYSVRRWIALGKLPAVKLGRRVLIHPDDLADLIARARSSTTAEAI